MIDDADLALVESHIYLLAENLMLEYAKYLDIKLCNSILEAIHSLTIKDNTMTICPVKLKEVLHDFATAMATMFNVGGKVLEEAKAKIEAIFEHEATESIPISEEAQPVATDEQNVPVSSPTADVTPSTSVVLEQSPQEPVA
jgi:hypothetical protein